MKIPGVSENWKQPVKIMLLMAFAIIVYWYLLLITFGSDKMIYQDILNHKVFQMQAFPNCCSWWPVSHLIFFAILAFFYPSDWLVLFLGGVLWEVVEIGAGKITLGAGWVPTAFRDQGKVEYSENWWAGSSKDIFFNTAGIILGVVVRYLYDKTKK